MNLVWLRRDLRATDNTALNRAIETGEPVVACYIATPTQWQQHHMAPIQADWIERRLHALSEELKQYNIPLLFAQVPEFKDCSQSLNHWCQSLGVTQVWANVEYEVNEVERDQYVSQQLQALDIPFTLSHDKCLLTPGSVLNKKGEYFKVFTPFKRAWLTQFMLPTISRTVTAPKVVIPDSLTESQISGRPSTGYETVSSADWSVESSDILNAMRQFCRDSIGRYDELRDIPSVKGTSQLSPYLALGALSPRQCAVRMYAEAQQHGLSSGAEVWLSELIWREFYHHLITFEPKLVKGSAFVDWEPAVAWRYDQAQFDAWCQGKTGYPIVDAAMKQLNATGWMHNRLRMIVASFLTKDLQIDWRWGERYFMSKLLDGDFAANNGGWQWSASTGCDGQPYFRIFNPISQGEKFDPDGRFVRQWLPELQSVPDKYIHKPWLWAGFGRLCYPSAMVDHKQQREITLAMFKQAKDSG